MQVESLWDAEIVLWTKLFSKKNWEIFSHVSINFIQKKVIEQLLKQLDYET